MMSTVIINAKINTGNSAQDIEDLKNDLQDLADTGAEVGEVEKKFNDLNAKMEAGGMSIKEMKQSMKEYMNIAAQAGADSPIGKQAIIQAGQLKDDLMSLNEEISRVRDGAANMQAVLQLSGTVVAGYTAFQGVTAMLGVENEKLLETLTKLQAAMSTLQALEQIRSALEKESFLMIKARAVQTQIMTGVQWAWNAALAANPIGLIVAALAALGLGIAAIVTKFKIFTDAWDLLKKGVSAVGDAIGIVYNWIVDTSLAMLDFINNSKAMRIALGILTLGMSELYLAGVNYAKSLYDQKKAADAAAEAERRRIEELRKKSDALNAAAMADIKMMAKAEEAAKKRHETEIAGIDFEIQKRQASGQQFADLEAKKLKMVIERAKEELAFEQAKNDRLKQLLEEQAKLYGVTQDAILAQYKKNGVDVDKIRTDRLKAEEDARKKVEEAEQKLTLFQLTEGKKRGDKQKELNKLSLEEQRALEDLMVANIKDANERRIAEMMLAQKREREAIIEKYGANSILLEQLEIKQANELSALRDEIIKEGIAKQTELENRESLAAAELKLLRARENFEIEIALQKELAALKRDQALQDDALTASERLKIEEEYSKNIEDLDKQLTEKRRAQKQAEMDALLSIGGSVVSGLRSIGEIAIKDQEKFNKFSAYLTASQMALDSAKAIAGAVAAASAIPFPGNIAAIASGVATVLANIATAVKAFRSANQGSAPALPTSSAQASGSAQDQGNQNNPNTTETATIMRGNGQQSGRVYVLEHDITTIQDHLNQVEVMSTIH